MIKKIFFLCFYWLFCVFAHAQNQKFPALEDLANKGAKISAYIMNLDNGETIATLNSALRLIPASISKIVLASAALEKWGAEHKFNTKIYTDGKKENNVLNGNLIVLGAGDPFLTNEKLWFLTTDVARQKIKQINGNLILNTSLFDYIEEDENRKAGKKQSTHAYDSPLSAIAVNFSVMAAVVSPNKIGEKASVLLEPYNLDNVKINNNVITDNNSKIQASRVRKNDYDEFNISGLITSNIFPIRSYKSVTNADEYSAYVLKAFLEHAGVKINGKIIFSKEDLKLDKLSPVSEIESYPLDWQLKGLMKVSNNFIADMLTINLSINENNSKASFKKGALYLENYTKKCVIENPIVPKNYNLDELIMDSGSGLTPSNRLSAFDVVSVLDRMYRTAREFPAFIASFPIPGVEGTVKQRFSAKNEMHLRTRLRAKTGSLSDPYDVISFAGYGRSLNGGWISFAIIVNGTSKYPILGAEKIRDVIDSDLAYLLPVNK